MTTMTIGPRRAAAGAWLLLLAATANAQTAQVPPPDSRVGEITERQAAKAQHLMPYVPSRVEGFLTTYEANLQKPTRIGANFGPMVSGAGMRLGVGFLTYTGDRTVLTAGAAYSLKHYKSVTVRLASPGHLRGHLDLEFNTVWRDAPQMPFYGLGNETPRSNRTNFLLQETWGTAGVRVRPTPWRPFSVLAEAQYIDYENGRGRGRTPNSADFFTPLEVPGLDRDPTYLRYTGEVALDTRTSPAYSRKGTLLRTAYSVFSDQDDARFDFDRVDVEVTQLIPLLRGNWVVALHGETSSTLTDGDNQVPFFLQPALGSGSTLRAYRSFRYRDRHSLYLSGEFRWTPNEALDFALFYDAGKVASRRKDLDLDGLHTDFGIGARFHGPAFTALRIEAAKGKEGLKLVFSTQQAW
jgi:hypothetical protein